MTTQTYEARAEIRQDQSLRLQLPPNVLVDPVRVAVIFEAVALRPAEVDDIKRLLAEMPDVGEDADLARPLGLPRQAPF